MSGNHDQSPLLDLLADRADHLFGDLQAVSGRALQRFSFPGQEAARNLLLKARRALDNEGLDRAVPTWIGRSGCHSMSTKVPRSLRLSRDDG